MDYTASTASIFNLVILSLDRYWSVTSPLRYLHKRTRRRARVLIGASWAAASLWLVPLLAWHHIFYDGSRQHPSHVCETEFSDSITFKIITSALNFYGPSALMAVLYCRIFRTIKTRSSDTLGRVTPIEASAVHVPSTPSGYHRQTYQSLTLVAYPDATRDPSTSFYKGVSVQVEYVGESSSSPTHTLHPKREKSSNNYKSQYLTPRRIPHGCTQKGHENHLACYPGSSPPQVWTSDLPSSASAGSDSGRWASFRNYKTGFAGLRGLLKEKKETTYTVPSNNIDRKPGALNIVKEKKAARQLMVIIGAFFACWIPYFTLFPIIAFCNDCIPARIHLAAIWLGYLNSALNPIIYPLCNQHFRRAFSRMLKCSR